MAQYQGRGMLTERIKLMSISKLGYEMTTTELRLMNYISYVMSNEQRINPARINQEEREIVSKWRELGYLTGGMNRMTITREFWDILCEFVWLGYVDLTIEE